MSNFILKKICLLAKSWDATILKISQVKSWKHLLLSYKLIWGYRQIRRKLFNTSGKSNRRHRLGQYLLEQIARNGCENM